MSYLNQRPKVHRLSRRAMKRPLVSRFWRNPAREALVSALTWHYRSHHARTQEIVREWADTLERAGFYDEKDQGQP